MAHLSQAWLIMPRAYVGLGENVFYQYGISKLANSILEVSVWTTMPFICCVQLSPGASVYFRGLFEANKMGLTVYLSSICVKMRQGLNAVV